MTGDPDNQNGQALDRYRTATEPETLTAIAKLRSATLHSGLDDWVAVEWIEGWAKHAGAAPDVEPKDLVLTVLAELLAEGLVELGSASGQGWTPWAGSREDLLQRIDRLLTAAQPHHGFTCWTRNTDLGDARVRQEPWHWHYAHGQWTKVPIVAFSHPRPGFELDWLGIDADDYVALFSTGGTGPIPQAVVQRLEWASAAIERVVALPILGPCAEAPSTNGGKLHFETWTEPCRRGFFSFDWFPQSAGPYRRLVVPAHPVRARELLDPLVGEAAGLARLPIRFADAASIATWQLSVRLWTS